METWFIILISLCISALLKTILNLLSTTKKPTHNLPPGPLSFPIVSNFIWLRKSFSEIEQFLRSLHSKFGPIITLRIGSRPVIFVADHSLAHQVLIQKGAVFADRPPAPLTGRIMSCNQHNINNAFYGPTWRLLRRNLTAEILYPPRVKSYSHARKWVLLILLDCLKSQSKSGDPVQVLDHFRYAMFCLLVLMCFGDKLDQNQIKEIEDVQHRLLLGLRRFNILNFWPRVTKIVLRKRWNEFYQLLQLEQDMFLPLIRARKKLKEETLSKAEQDNKNEYVLSYVDTLLDLQLPEEKRKLEEEEIVSLCSEFLTAGTDTTSTALQWIMANLVKYPHIQEKLFAEIEKVVRDGEEEVKEDDLQEMPYLKAVILEGLRRHPPTHFVLPHAATEDTILDGFLVPKNGIINFMVAEMGWDPNVWEDPMAFKPERFLNNDDSREVFDITGSREIKMMPFGVGRRICPAYGLAMLHLEYFVANLIWNFEWKPVDGDEVNLEEKQEFTILMKNPLQAHIRPRIYQVPVHKEFSHVKLKEKATQCGVVEEALSLNYLWEKIKKIKKTNLFSHPSSTYICLYHTTPCYYNLTPQTLLSLTNTETWFIILITLCISALLKALLNLVSPTKKPTHKLPPGPPTFPIIGNVLWIGKSFSELEPFFRSLHAKFGPIITVHIGPLPIIFIADHSLAHQALIQNGAVFANRPPALATNKIMNRHTIHTAFHGLTWRLLRRNLTAEILHPSRVKSYSHARKWVLQILLDFLKTKSKSGDPVHVVDHFQYAIVCLLVFMCFGDKLDQNQIKEVEDVQRRVMLGLRRFNILNFWPTLTKIVFRKLWNELHQLHQLQQDTLIPLIRARNKMKEEKFSEEKEDQKKEEDKYVLSYVDTLLEFQLPEEKRKLNEGEIVSLCSEFLNGGTDSTSTTLLWIMANLVKYPHIQEKLFMEVKGFVKDGEEMVKEDDLQIMPYLKAVIMEGLRRHPPSHFVLPHTVTEDVVLNGFLVPKNGIVNFMMGDMGLDPKVWEDPMTFKPERFLNNDNCREVVDITGSREIKMMPFGAGRRICPGYGLAILHLEYFVANLIWNFEWKAVDGDEVNLEEKLEVMIVMKNPLKVHICPRLN